MNCATILYIIFRDDSVKLPRWGIVMMMVVVEKVVPRHAGREQHRDDDGNERRYLSYCTFHNDEKIKCRFKVR